MMRAVGIVAEYNPLHNGHVYHIERAKQLSGADAAVVAMSGDFVQRGEPAIFDKWTRSRHALKSGADLVLEIPVKYCLSHAGEYAGAGAGILESVPQISHIAFGSECGDTGLLKTVAGVLDRYEDDIKEIISAGLRKGISYPAAREEAYRKVAIGKAGIAGSIGDHIAAELEVLGGSNDILAVEYIRAMRKAEPIAIRREGAGYNDALADVENADDNDCSGFASATGIRNAVRELRNTEERRNCGTCGETVDIDEIKGIVGRYVPECVMDDFARVHITDTDEWWNILRYAVMTLTAEEIDECPSGGEGLGNLMKKAIMAAGNPDEFVDAVKSKRYTRTRISRLCMQAVLGIRRLDSDYLIAGDAEKFERDAGIPYIRVLGFTEEGRRLLAEMREDDSAGAKVITNINKEAGDLDEAGRRLLELDVHAADIYNLVTGRDVTVESDHRMMPVIV